MPGHCLALPYLIDINTNNSISLIRGIATTKFCYHPKQDGPSATQDDTIVALSSPKRESSSAELPCIRTSFTRQLHESALVVYNNSGL